MLTLFGHEDSGHAYKVRLMLRVAGLEHHYRWVDIWAERETRAEQFRAKSTFQEVPLLLDGDEHYVQSGAILLYLAEKTGRFGGESPTRMARSREWLLWEANKIGLCLPQIRSKVAFGDETINDGALSWLMARYDHDVQLLDRTIISTHGWVLEGPEPSIADFALCGYLFLAHQAELELPPGVQAWLDRIQSLPGWGNHTDLLSQSAQTAIESPIPSL